MDLAERPIDLAAALVAAGARLTVIGGTARRLRDAGDGSGLAALDLLLQ